ncbi:hypothetical protein L1987_39819 [Smallanthus sonchifolius]|uniref:Uncharacterized protein n=1 Tax=Smallanthus sonchifolius TaxID=185202 RepID=A0ACB9GTG3_9ASTR|nr:hypothetical protein L1987_39819 [Smallanthus sonchifolius]
MNYSGTANAMATKMYEKNLKVPLSRDSLDDAAIKGLVDLRRMFPDYGPFRSLPAKTQASESAEHNQSNKKLFMLAEVLQKIEESNMMSILTSFLFPDAINKLFLRVRHTLNLII